MINYISGLIFVILLIVGGAVVASMGMASPALAVLVGIVWLVLDIIIASGCQLAAQWERGVVFRLGKFSSHQRARPFLHYSPRGSGQAGGYPYPGDGYPGPAGHHQGQRAGQDQRRHLLQGGPGRQDAIIKVQDYRYAISQYAQTALRDVIGQMTLDQLLSEREQIAKMIEAAVEKDTEGWGLEVTGINILDVDMPEELKKMMSRQASAETGKARHHHQGRRRQGSRHNLAAAAMTMAASPGAMQLADPSDHRRTGAHRFQYGSDRGACGHDGRHPIFGENLERQKRVQINP